MNEYEVRLDLHVHRHVTIRANSPEEAAGKALRLKEALIDGVRMLPTSVSYSDADGCYEVEVVGTCEACKGVLLGREIPGQPWNYTVDGGDCMTCYRCSTTGARYRCAKCEDELSLAQRLSGNHLCEQCFRSNLNNGIVEA